MAASDTFQTIAAPSTGEFRDRGSKFLGYAFPLKELDDWSLFLAGVRKEHPKARHYCYAYRIGRDQNNFRANDDGEPSGTAGRPILGQIDKLELTNVLVVVVRYFGGTLLGTSGLINAYRNSAAEALSQATIATKIVEDVYRLSFDYAHMNKVMGAIANLPAEMIAQNFDTSAAIDIAIRQSEVQSTLRRLRAQVAEVYLEEVDQLEEIPGFEFEFQYSR